MNRNPFEIAFDNVLAGAAYASQSSDSASVKEQHMDNVNHPKHYENGPFECIELTRLLSFDWAGLSDVWKALAFGPRQKVLTVLVRKIAELENEKDGE